jgi:zinc transporter 1/2/3
LARLLWSLFAQFGVIFHSIFIGLTLATTGGHSAFVMYGLFLFRSFLTSSRLCFPSRFPSSLFIVIIFHQTFEGLGLGARLAFLPLPRKLKSVSAPFFFTFPFLCLEESSSWRILFWTF